MAERHCHIKQVEAVPAAWFEGYPIGITGHGFLRLISKIGIPFTAPEGRGTPVWWRPLDTRSLDLITRARFRRWTNASVTRRPAASTSIVCAGLRDSPAPIAERRGSHGGWQGDGCGVGPAANRHR